MDSERKGKMDAPAVRQLTGIAEYPKMYLACRPNSPTLKAPGTNSTHLGVLFGPTGEASISHGESETSGSAIRIVCNAIAHALDRGWLCWNARSSGALGLSKDGQTHGTGVLCTLCSI
jgi:hypothetical protein